MTTTLERTHGPAYVQARDGHRLRDQRSVILAILTDGQWHTVAEIARFTGYPETSVSAQIRHLRKPLFGEHCIEREKGVIPARYRLIPPKPVGQASLF